MRATPDIHPLGSMYPKIVRISDRFDDSRIPGRGSGRLGIQRSEPGVPIRRVSVAEPGLGALESLSCNRRASQTTTRRAVASILSVTRQETRNQFYCIFPCLLTRLAYGCKFASLGYRGYDVARIRFSAEMPAEPLVGYGETHQLRRSLSRAPKRKRRSSRNGTNLSLLPRADFVLCDFVLDSGAEPDSLERDAQTAPGI